MWYTYYDTYNTVNPVFVSPFLVGTSYKNTIREDERSLYDGFGRPVQTQAVRTEVFGSGDRDVITTIRCEATSTGAASSSAANVIAGSTTHAAAITPEPMKRGNDGITSSKIEWSSHTASTDGNRSIVTSAVRPSIRRSTEKCRRSAIGGVPDRACDLSKTMMTVCKVVCNSW